METDSLASGYHFFLPYSDTPATDSFIFPANEKVFVNKPCILVSQSGFSGWCKPLSHLFSRHRRCIFETNCSFWMAETGYLVCENQFFPFFRYSYQLKLFSAYCKFIFTTNPLVWLMETDFLASGNHFVHFLKYIFSWKQFFHLVEIYFKRILYYGQRYISERHSFIHTFFETIIVIKGRPIFKKLLFLLVEAVFFKFFRHWFKWKQSCGPLKSYFSTNPSFWLMKTIFG